MPIRVLEIILAVGVVAAPLVGVWIGHTLSTKASEAQHDREVAERRDDADRARAVRLLQVSTRFEATMGGIFYVGYMATQPTMKQPPKEDVRDATRIGNETMRELLDVCLEVKALGPAWAQSFANAQHDDIEVLLDRVTAVDQMPSNSTIKEAESALIAQRQAIDNATKEFARHLMSGG